MRRGITVISMPAIRRLWAENGLDEKLESGDLHPIVVHETLAMNPTYAGGRSRIVKVFTVNGQHIGTVHEISLPDGSVPHRHPKDYTLRDCTRVRVDSEFQG